MLQNETFALPKSKEKRLLKQLKTAHKKDDVEKAVERSVINMLETYFNEHPGYINVETTYPFNTDGIVSADAGLFGESINILLEAKRDKNFTDNKKDVLETIAQSISYLHTIKENNAHKYPRIIVIADNDEIFMLPSIALNNYVDNDYDWTLPASEMYKDKQLMQDLGEDKNIRPIINDINENFNVSDFCMRMTNVSLGAEYEKIKINKKILIDAFEIFRKMVYGTNDPNVIQDENREQIELFCRTLFGDEDVFAHPKKKNVMYIDGVEHDGLDTNGYEVFSSRYDSNGYSLKEYMEITEMADTLIAEANRRFKGDYYTPKVWVKKAHEVITTALGDNWRDKYVVWDPAAGTKNLTRDYMFKDLYSSTLYEGELMSTRNFNKDNVSFQYDFLNDDMCLHDGTYTLEDIKNMSDEELEDILKMDTGLVKKMINKESIVLFANPPYGQSGSGQGKIHKTGATNTRIGELMRKEKFGHASGELYTQFIYRVQLLAKFFEYEENDEFHIFFFNKGFLTSPNFGKFVDGLTSQFSFHEGFMINAGEFNGTSAAWGIIFSHWSLNGDKNQKEFPFEVLESTPNGDTKKITEWNARKVEKNKTLVFWMKELGQSTVDINKPGTRNGFDAPNSNTDRTRVGVNALGTIMQAGSTVSESDNRLGILTMGSSRGNGYDVTPDNFTRASVTFSFRRAMKQKIAQQKQLWIRDKDVFTTPSDELLTDEFIADCVVYSLFDTQSSQTSLRNYEYNGNTYRVINEFFPFSLEFVERLAVKHKNMSIQSDVIGDTDRFVYKWLEEHKEDLSDEAQTLLNLAKELYEITFKYRDEYAKLQPRFQTNSWDAGYAQIARLAFGNERINDEFLDFKKKFYSARKDLGNKIAEKAIEDGVI